MLRNFRIDLLSLGLGFVAATLFWWLISRMRPLMPGVWASIKKFIQNVSQQNLEGADVFLRKDTLRRAQKMHLTASMFAMDEVILPPKLLAPPVPIEPDQIPPQEPIASQIIPYMPDWPELAAGHGAATFDLSDALQNGCSIAIIGQPGCGKTTMLASFASQLSRKDPELGKLREFIPIFLHILDLQLELPENRDPLPALLKAITPHVAVIYQGQLARLVRDRLRDGQAILILDGLDELHPTALTNAANYLKALREKFPHLQMVTAASPYFLDGLIGVGLTPLGVVAWGPAQRSAFLARWSQAWAAHIAPEIAKQQSLSPISPLLIDNWLLGERGFPTPLEWTLKVWGAYSGDLQPTPLASLQTLFVRFASGVTTESALEALANEFIIREQAAISYSDLDKLLTGLLPSSPVFSEASSEKTSTTSPDLENTSTKKEKQGKRDIILSVGEEILEKLVRGGILIEHQGSLIRFANPAFAGYLSGRHTNIEFIAAALRSPFWALANQGLRYAAATSDDGGWIETFLHSEDTPLDRPILTAARWLVEGKPGTAWRGSMFRRLLNGVQNEKLPFSLRSRMLSAFVYSSDPSVPKLFKQLTISLTPSVRMLAALGIGAWGDAGMAGDLISMLGDQEEIVRNAACLGLVSLHSDSALSAVADVLLNGDEKMRQAAAESLVYLPKQGAEIIREAAQVNDLLTRRAAVFGLLQIHEPWSKQLLEKMAVEDGQWVVRNAAAQALEFIQEIDPRIPKPLLPPHESPWLTGFAGKRNIGLSPYQPATDALILALKSGTLEDQMAALRYLKDIPEETAIRAVYEMLISEQPEIKDAALLTIWYWALAGVQLPTPTLYGFTLN